MNSEYYVRAFLLAISNSTTLKYKQPGLGPQTGYIGFLVKQYLAQMVKVTDPTPAPPLHGRGVPIVFHVTNMAAAAPLPCRGGVGVGSVSSVPRKMTHRLPKNCGNALL